ncbi:MAG: PAS domain-containing protein [Rhodospirillales bacterium]|nr:PAS domain-containing protein [Rhodospirillales bacterium]
MKPAFWLVCVALTAAAAGVVAGAAWLCWTALDPDQQAAVAAALAPHTGVLMMATALLVVLPALVVMVMAGFYVAPMRGMAEEVRVIAVSNAKHRLRVEGQAEVRKVAANVNLLAERYQTLQEDVALRIRDANAAIEIERNTFATLVSKLTQGILVCNRDGRILLYNQRAQRLLEGAERETGGGDWIGLGRSVYSVLDKNVINHALATIEHLDQQGKSRQMVPFVISRISGQLLNVHLVPIPDPSGASYGYILSIEDVTRRINKETRRASLLLALTEGHRSGIASIRGAIEAIIAFPDMDEEERTQFQSVIHEESVRLSQQLAELEERYPGDLDAQGPLQDVLGSDLLAAIERHVEDAIGVVVDVSAPLEPVWLRADSYAIARCLIFLIDQLRRICRASEPSISLHHGRALVTLMLEWTGAALDTEALRSWGLRQVIASAKGGSQNLFDVIERHSGAIWAHPISPAGRPCLRLVLPVGGEDSVSAVWGEEEDDSHDFDFHLFEPGGGTAAAPDTPLGTLSFTVIDTETTGLDPSGGDEIIAIAAVRIVNGRILRREVFDVLVNPGRPIGAAAQAIHGISGEMLRSMPPIEDVLPRFHRFLEDTVIVGHNVAFDLRFLELKEGKTGLKFAHPVLDTLLLELVLHPNQEDKTLEAIAGRLGVTVSGRHTALGDAMATAEVFLALIPLLAEHGIHSVRDAQTACDRLAMAQVKY